MIKHCVTLKIECKVIECGILLVKQQPQTSAGLKKTRNRGTKMHSRIDTIVSFSQTTAVFGVTTKVL